MSLVSVIIPTYNRNDLLFGRCLPSVLAQTHREVEVLVVSDGMEGEQLEDLESRYKALQFETEFPLRLWVVDRQPYPDDQHLRWGLSGLAARNFGLDHARGEFVAALDDDDRMLPDAIERLVGEMDDSVDFVYGISETWKDGRTTGQLYGRYPPGDGALCNGAYVYRTSLPYRFDLDCTSRGRAGDADMWLRMLDGGVRFRFLPRIVHQYHRNWP